MAEFFSFAKQTRPVAYALTASVLVLSQHVRFKAERTSTRAYTLLPPVRAERKRFQRAGI